MNIKFFVSAVVALFISAAVFVSLGLWIGLNDGNLPSIDWPAALAVLGSIVVLVLTVVAALKQYNVYLKATLVVVGLIACSAWALPALSKSGNSVLPLVGWLVALAFVPALAFGLTYLSKKFNNDA